MVQVCSMHQLLVCQHMHPSERKPGSPAWQKLVFPQGLSKPASCCCKLLTQCILNTGSYHPWTDLGFRFGILVYPGKKTWCMHIEWGWTFPHFSVNYRSPVGSAPVPVGSLPLIQMCSRGEEETSNKHWRKYLESKSVWIHQIFTPYE